MKLFVWQPKSYGPFSYFVMAATLEEAEEKVREYIAAQAGNEFVEGFPQEYQEVEIHEQGSVVVNRND